MSFKKASIIGLWFGGFQALMPIIGYFLGTTFESFLTSVDHWIAFVLLVFIGGKMIKDAFDKKTEEKRLEKKQQDSGDSVTVTADSWDELLKKIDHVVMSDMADEMLTEEERRIGQNFDFTL